MIAYMFQKYSENFAFQLFITLCSNLPVKFAVFSIVFSVYKQNFMAQ